MTFMRCGSLQTNAEMAFSFKGLQLFVNLIGISRFFRAHSVKYFRFYWLGFERRTCNSISDNSKNWDRPGVSSLRWWFTATVLRCGAGFLKVMRLRESKDSVSMPAAR